MSDKIEDPVVVPRGLLGAASYAIANKADAPKTLAELRRYAFQKQHAPAAVPTNCRQLLMAEGKPFPRSSCAACGQFSPKWRECDAMLAAAPAAPVAVQEPSEEAAYQIGAKGAEPTEAERLLFEAWMRGHCWAVAGEWNGRTYVAADEDGRRVNQHAMLTRQLWAAWRDRASLTGNAALAQHAAEQLATVAVPFETLRRIHRDLDSCQKVIWLAGCRPRGYGFDPAYVTDAQARLKEIDALLAGGEA